MLDLLPREIAIIGCIVTYKFVTGKRALSRDAIFRLNRDATAMIDNRKPTIVSIVGAIMIGVIVIGPCHAIAQGEGASPGKLVVGTMNMPPFLIKGEDGHWEGLGIELWQAVARELGVKYELREYTRVESLMDDVLSGKIDIIPAMAVTETNEVILDFSRQYLRSGLAIAISAKESGSRLLRLAGRLAVTDILMMLGLLLLLSLVAGIVVWMFEGRLNSQFHGNIVQGAGHGLWWAVVTLTTVGYGDKAPKTLGGRLTALIWMFSSIFLIASFTAAITTTLTVGELGGKIRGFEDLPDVRVGALAQSEGPHFLKKNGITSQQFENVRDGLQALVDKNIDAFVFDESVLKYMAKKEFAGKVAVLPHTFGHYYVGMGMRTDSPLKEQINLSLLRIIAGDEWEKLEARYIGIRP